jgi:hypothetical protein
LPATAWRFVGLRIPNGGSVVVVVGGTVVVVVVVVVVLVVVVLVVVVEVVVLLVVDGGLEGEIFTSTTYEVPCQASGLPQQTPVRSRYVPGLRLIDIYESSPNCESSFAART